MEQLQYNRVNFDNIVPVLELDSSVQALQDSFASQGLEANLNQMQRNADIERDNLKAYQESLGELAKFSDSAREQFVSFKNQQAKNEAVDLFSQGIQDAVENPVTQEQLKKAFEEAEAEDAAEREDLNKAVDANLQNKKDKGGITVEDTAAAAGIRELTSDRQIIYNNGRASIAAQSYGPAFDKFISDQNEARKEAGLKLLDPTSEEYREKRRQFDRAWSEATGLYQANSAFAAAKVYPLIADQRRRSENAYSKIYEYEAGAEQRADLEARLSEDNGLQAYFRGYVLTKNRDGSYKTIQDAYQNLAALQLPAQTIRDLGTQSVTINGKTIKFGDHPRFQGLLTAARNRDNAVWQAGKAELQQRLNKEDVSQMTDEQLRAYGERLKEEDDTYSGVINNWVASNMEKNATARQEQRWDDQIQEAVVRNGGELPADYFDAHPEIPLTVQYRYLRFMPDGNQQETINEQIRDNKFFKDISKDDRFNKALQGILGNKIKFAEATTGQQGPSNYGEFKILALDNIANRAQLLMYGESALSEDEAIRQAISNWSDDMKDLDKEDKLFDINNQKFLGTSLKPNRGLQQAGAMVVRDLNSTEWNNMGKGLYESDWDSVPDLNKGEEYSERVKFLGRKFNLTPREVVAVVRKQKNLVPIDDGYQPWGENTVTRNLGDDTPAATRYRAQTGENQGIEITQRIDRGKGQGGTDFVISNGLRGARFYFPYKFKVQKVVRDQNWESHINGENDYSKRRGYGNYVDIIVYMPGGYTTEARIAHFDEINSFQAGDVLPAGAFVGTQGRTGSTSGAHISIDWYVHGAAWGTQDPRARDMFLKDYLDPRHKK